MNLKTLQDIGIKPNPDFSQLRKVLLRESKPAYVPFYELFVNVPVMETILGKKVPDRISTIEFYFSAGYDYVPVWPGVPIKKGSLVDRREGYPISSRADFDAYVWPKQSEITRFSNELINKCGADGGYALGSGNSIPDYVPVENYLAMLSASWARRC